MKLKHNHLGKDVLNFISNVSLALVAIGTCGLINMVNAPVESQALVTTFWTITAGTALVSNGIRGAMNLLGRT